MILDGYMQIPPVAGGSRIASAVGALLLTPLSAHVHLLVEPSYTHAFCTSTSLSDNQSPRTEFDDTVCLLHVLSTHDGPLDDVHLPGGNTSQPNQRVAYL